MSPDEHGLMVTDLSGDDAFARRKVHDRDIGIQMTGLQRLSHALLERPDSILQELVNAAVDLCGADSAGISIERQGGSDQEFYHWIATAGAYSNFMDAILPRQPSACGVTLERGRPQHFTVTKKFFDILGVEAPLVTDGLLLPWQTEDSRGTIFVMAHGRTEAFDANDASLMTMLADFAAMGYRQQRQQEARIAQERIAAAAQMAHTLAHEINNPLQSMTNSAYLIAQGSSESQERGSELFSNIQRLSGLVKNLLALPFEQSSSDKK